ncbi:MAG: CHAD domain-containing protein [Coleofasciculaceae cyanobacterium]
MTKTRILEAKTFGDWAYLAVEKHFQKIISYEKDVLKDTDPENLHQMRVGMRRLRTVVSGFALALDLPKAAKEKEIAKVARSLGELRDLDVLQDTIQDNYLPKLPSSEQELFKPVLSTLIKQRKKSLEQVKNSLSQQSYQKLKLACQEWLKRPKYGEIAEIDITDILPDLLLPSFSKFFLHPAWLVGVKLEAGEINISNSLNREIVSHLLSNHGDSLHSLRKEAKRVRYQMELFTDFYCPRYKDYLKDIKAIQKVLGEIQDSFVLAEFLRDTLGSDLTAQLPTLTAQLTENSYQAWQNWATLQQLYLEPGQRRNLQQIILQPVSPTEQQKKLDIKLEALPEFSSHGEDIK